MYKTKGKVNASKIMKGSKLNYKIVTAEELNERLLKGEEDFYYFTFIQFTAMVEVHHSLTGKEVYSTLKVKKLKLNITDEDFKKLSRATRKG